MNEFIPRKVRREQERAEQSARIKSTNMRQMGRRMLLWFSVIAGVAALIGLMAYLIGNQSTDNTANGPVADVTSADWVEGGKDAKVALIEYSDFQCPACGYYYPLVKKLNQEFGEKLRIAYRHFPLAEIHPNADLAARSAEAAGRQNKFWEMHDMLFERQKEWSVMKDPKKTFLSYAEQIGLDASAFEKDLDSEDVKRAVEEDRKSGLDAKISGTPTFFLGGKKIPNPQSYDEFRNLIAKELEKNP